MAEPTKESKGTASSDVLQQIVSAALKTPGNIAGGGVDLSNMVLGLLTGKGLGGFVDKPIGGSKQINESLGLTDKSGGLIEDSLSAILGLLSPGGLAKGAAIGLGGAALLAKMAMAPSGKGANRAATAASQKGIIAADTLGVDSIAKLLGIDDVTARALAMKADGKTPWAIGTESEKALAAKRNPGDAMSVFIGPDGLPRIKFDTKNARIAKSADIQVNGQLAELGPSMRAAKGDMTGPTTLLSDLLLHPSLYDISPAARSATVEHSVLADLFGTKGSYSPLLNSIQLPATSFGGPKLRNDPLGDLLETLLHEATHGVQIEQKTRGGTSPSVQSLQKTLTEARAQGSYRTPAELNVVEQYLTRLATTKDPKLTESPLQRLYMNSYGEWEARQASEKGRSLPLMNEGGLTW